MRLHNAQVKLRADIENRRKAAYRRKIDTAAKGAKEGA